MTTRNLTQVAISPTRIDIVGCVMLVVVDVAVDLLLLYLHHSDDFLVRLDICLVVHVQASSVFCCYLIIKLNIGYDCNQ